MMVNTMSVSRAISMDKILLYLLMCSHGVNKSILMRGECENILICAMQRVTMHHEGGGVLSVSASCDDGQLWCRDEGGSESVVEEGGLK